MENNIFYHKVLIQKIVICWLCCLSIDLAGSVVVSFAVNLLVLVVALTVLFGEAALDGEALLLAAD